MKCFKFWKTRRPMYRQSNHVQLECFWCVGRDDDVVSPSPIAIVRRGSTSGTASDTTTAQPTPTPAAPPAATEAANNSQGGVITVRFKICNPLNCNRDQMRLQSFLQQRRGFKCFSTKEPAEPGFITVAVMGTFDYDKLVEDIAKEFTLARVISLDDGDTIPPRDY